MEAENQKLKDEMQVCKVNDFMKFIFILTAPSLSHLA